MKFVFYIVELETGEVNGTNDADVVEEFVENDDYVIIHSEGSFFCGDRTEYEVQNIEDDGEEEEDEDSIDGEDD